MIQFNVNLYEIVTFFSLPETSHARCYSVMGWCVGLCPFPGPSSDGVVCGMWARGDGVVCCTMSISWVSQFDARGDEVVCHFLGKRVWRKG